MTHLDNVVKECVWYTLTLNKPGSCMNMTKASMGTIFATWLVWWSLSGGDTILRRQFSHAIHNGTLLLHLVPRANTASLYNVCTCLKTRSVSVQCSRKLHTRVESCLFRCSTCLFMSIPHKKHASTSTTGLYWLVCSKTLQYIAACPRLAWFLAPPFHVCAKYIEHAPD